MSIIRALRSLLSIVASSLGALAIGVAAVAVSQMNARTWDFVRA
jgi:hypothetical protein